LNGRPRPGCRAPPRQSAGRAAETRCDARPGRVSSSTIATRRSASTIVEMMDDRGSAVHRGTCRRPRCVASRAERHSSGERPTGSRPRLSTALRRRARLLPPATPPRASKYTGTARAPIRLRLRGSVAGSTKMQQPARADPHGAGDGDRQDRGVIGSRHIRQDGGPSLG
jgi:hypothetical protein